MNRKNLTAAVLAGLAGAAGIVGSAQAVNVNPDGLGQLLLYPYYTTNGGNQTMLSVVNTTENSKAVKVRFLEGQNSREVLDFNLYMSPYDVWTAAIYNNDGVPTMVTGDTTCTVPYIYGDFGGTQPFLPWALTDEAPDSYGDVNVRGSEGHFEMIEMGTITDELTPKLDDNGDPVVPEVLVPTYGTDAAVTHVDGTPKDCAQLVKAWTRSAAGDGYWIGTKGENLRDLSAPSGGLFGGAAIVNVQRGTMYSYDARAINGFADTVAAADLTKADDMHQEPGTILPSLDSGGRMDAYVFGDDGNQYSATLDRGVDAVSYVFMHDQLMNEYTTEAVVSASTEWVITFPTKQFYVHQAFLDDYADFRTTNNGGTEVPAYYRTTTPVAPATYGNFIPNDPFTSSWTWVPEVIDPDTDEVVTPGYVDLPCEVVTIDSIWDREEADPAAAPPGPDRPPIVSPAPPDERPDGLPSFSLCYETQIIVFGAIEEGPTPKEGGSGILGSANVTTVDNGSLGFEYGWMRLGLVDYSHDSDQDGTIEPLFRAPLGLDGDPLVGMPVTGFAVQQFENSFLGEGASTLANYGGIFGHKGTRLISDGASATYPTDCNVKGPRNADLDTAMTGPADSICRKK